MGRSNSSGEMVRATPAATCGGRLAAPRQPSPQRRQRPPVQYPGGGLLSKQAAGGAGRGILGRPLVAVTPTLLPARGGTGQGASWATD